MTKTSPDGSASKIKQIDADDEEISAGETKKRDMETVVSIQAQDDLNKGEKKTSRNLEMMQDTSRSGVTPEGAA